MPTTRFRVRSLMIFVALAAVGSWVAVMAWRYWTTVSMLQGGPGPALLPFYAALALAVAVSLSLIIIGVTGLVVRLQAVLRATSRRPGRIRPDP